MRFYPRLGQIRRASHPQGLCALCGENKANGRVDVQTDEFRGNDVVYKVHLSCVRGVDQNVLVGTLIARDDRDEGES